MTEKEFYRVLSGLKYEAKIRACNRIRLTSEIYVGSKSKTLDLCPVTAVAMFETGAFFETYKYRVAAKRLGLEEAFSEEIAAGADNRVFAAEHWPITELEQRFIERSKKRRVEIIEALGMESE